MAQHRSFHTRRDLDLPRAAFEVSPAAQSTRPAGAHRAGPTPLRRPGRRLVVAAVAAGMLGGIAGVSQLGDPALAIARLASATGVGPPVDGPAPARPAAPPVMRPPPASAAPAPTSSSPTSTAAPPTSATGPPKSSAAAPPAPPEPSAPSKTPAAPAFVRPADGSFTSGFGSRWGVLHAGVDIANSIGTPIRAVTSGTVLEAGPASGFGLWVRLQHSDGTVSVYGHMNTINVSAGQHVATGQEIATIGNRGNSTGPHLHFEVWQNGLTKIDPLPWLSTRGIAL